jgi:PPM family protein phosphatase
MPRHKTKTRRYTHTAIHKHVLEPFTYAQRSIACERHPHRNEDSILVDRLTGLVAVFDGVGGSAAGEIASQTASHATYQAWKEILSKRQKGRKTHSFLEEGDTSELCSVLEQLIQEADERVRTDGAKQAGTDDLATTVAMAAFSRHPETRGYTMVYAHVGDSRVYLLRGQEPLKRLTSDDGLLAKLVENQIIDDTDALRIDQAMRADQLSDTEFSYFRLRGGITQALGGPLPPTIHTNQMRVFPGDRILLCTDGIHDNLIDEEIEQIMRSSPRTTTARILVERSLQRSHQERSETIRAKPDDMSAITLVCRF